MPSMRVARSFAILPCERRTGRGSPSVKTSSRSIAIVTGIGACPSQQAEPLRAAGVELTPEVIAKNRWYAFWDAPLFIPEPPAAGRGQSAARTLGPPRTAAEIGRASASFNTSSCTVKTDGNSLEATFPGLTMGSFAGDLRFTVYRGTNLMRMDAVASTNDQWVAYKYDGGLADFSTALTPRVTWRDTGGHDQQYAFGGVANDTIVPLKAANRVLVAEGKGASIATFPMPHTFFFTREVDTNLGYVWYRLDEGKRFAFGVRQADREEVAQYAENFALFNAPPGTKQRMGVYFYVTPEAADSTRQAVLAFTHDDTFKPVPGYKTMVNHFHLRFTERVRASGSFDTPMQDLAAMKSLGLNIVGLSDFHGDLHANDPGPVRFKDQKDYREATRRASDADFLITPWEEPSAYFGGHYNIMFPQNVYWSKVRQPGQPFTETRSGLRQGLSHRNCRGCPADDGRRGRLLVSRASAHQGNDGLSGSDFRQGLDQERSLSRERVQAGNGNGPVGDAAVRVALFRFHRYDEQPVCRLGPASEVHHRRHRHVSEGSGRRSLSELPGELPAARSSSGPRRGLESRAEGLTRRPFLRDHRRDPDPFVRRRR